MNVTKFCKTRQKGLQNTLRSDVDIALDSVSLACDQTVDQRRRRRTAAVCRQKIDVHPDKFG